MEELGNPVKLIEFILNFAKGVIDFMNSSIWLPLVGNMPIWSFFVGALIPLLLFIITKRLIT